MTGPAAPPHVSVRALILALSRFEIAARDKTRVLEKGWAIYRKNRRLSGEEKVVAEMPESCPHLDSREGPWSFCTGHVEHQGDRL